MVEENIMEQYAFQNIYIITTYRCNWACGFCLFRFKKEKEAPPDVIIDRLEYSIKNSPQRVYIKITGGEPFLKTRLLQRIFEIAEVYRDRVYKIGIGTNGSIPLPSFFEHVLIKTHIFLSRHSIKDNLPQVATLSNGLINSVLDFRINCNLIRGGVDSLANIKQHIAEKSKQGVTHFCFRELSKVNVDANSMYPPQIHDYVDYYDKHLVPYAEIKVQLDEDKQFQQSRETGNYYDRNYWYWYNTDESKISVKFRAIDEARLIEYNTNVQPDEVDEYVIHPDGTLTGCWDKELKVIFKGGE